MRGLRVVDGTRNKLQQPPAALAALAVEEIVAYTRAGRRGGRDAHPRPPRAAAAAALGAAARRPQRKLARRDPASLCALPKVDTIKLANNRLTSLYASGGGWVCPTPSLAHLDLSSNQLVDLGELPLQLSPERMRTLSLENNALTAVPAALSRLSALGTLGLAGNPQRQVRQGLLEKGTLAIMEYLRTMAPPTATAADDHGAATGAGGGAAAAARSEVDELGARLDAVTAELQAPGLSEAKKYALKKDAAKVKAEKIRAEPAEGEPPDAAAHSRVGSTRNRASCSRASDARECKKTSVTPPTPPIHAPPIAHMASNSPSNRLAQRGALEGVIIEHGFVQVPTLVHPRRLVVMNLPSGRCENRLAAQARHVCQPAEVRCESGTRGIRA